MTQTNSPAPVLGLDGAGLQNATITNANGRSIIEKTSISNTTSINLVAALWWTLRSQGVDLPAEKGVILINGGRR